MYMLGNWEQKERLTKGNPSNLQELISDAPFEAWNCQAMKKPTFLFRERVLISDEPLFEEESKSLVLVFWK